MTKKKKFKDFPGNLIKIKVLEDEISYFKTQIQEHFQAIYILQVLIVILVARQLLQQISY
jgi:hypothetical protein